jgi:HTH-type transcriptional regulator/antitoxin HipB
LERKCSISSGELLAKTLKAVRVSNGLTQKDVAQLIGIKQATVSAFENHPERSRVETLFKLLAALGLELHVTQRDQNQNQHAWDEEW